MIIESIMGVIIIVTTVMKVMTMIEMTDTYPEIEVTQGRGLLGEGLGLQGIACPPISKRFRKKMMMTISG
jgi:hypothetical protein